MIFFLPFSNATVWFFTLLVFFRILFDKQNDWAKNRRLILYILHLLKNGSVFYRLECNISSETSKFPWFSIISLLKSSKVKPSPYSIYHFIEATICCRNCWGDLLGKTITIFPQDLASFFSVLLFNTFDLEKDWHKSFDLFNICLCSRGEVLPPVTSVVYCWFSKWVVMFFWKKGCHKRVKLFLISTFKSNILSSVKLITFSFLSTIVTKL